jgi:hypothetical protein
MTDDKKHDDKDRKKLSDEEMEDVAGGNGGKAVLVTDDSVFGVSKKKATHSEGSGDTAVSGEL